MIKALNLAAVATILASVMTFATVADAKGGGGGGGGGGKGSYSGGSHHHSFRVYSPAPVCVQWYKQHCVAWN
jgi:hypothetical protein